MKLIFQSCILIFCLFNTQLQAQTDSLNFNDTFDAIYQDYGFKNYGNARPKRFLSVDPIARQYPELTPYQFASNRPIDGIDLDGLEFFNAILKRASLDGLKKVTTSFVKDQIKERLQKYANKNWSNQLLADVDGILSVTQESWVEIIGEAIVEQIPWIGPFYSAYDAASEASKIRSAWKKLQKLADKADVYVKRIDDAFADLTTLYGKMPKANKDLRDALKLKDKDGNQAHHLIPINLLTETGSDESDFVKAAIAGGFDFNKVGNGLGLKTLNHSGSHPNYDIQVRKKIAALGDLTKYSPEDAAKELLGITTDIKNQINNAIKANPNIKVNEIIIK